MSILRNISLALAFFTILVGLTFAQPIISTGNSNSSSTTKTQADFVSEDGEFSIALPMSVTSYGAINPIEGATKGGSKFTWETPQGFFMVSFLQHNLLPENHKTYLETVVNMMIEKVVNSGGKLVSKKELSLNGNSGIEIKVSLNGVIVIQRNYLTNSRSFTLTSEWKEAEDGAIQIRILDSFKLIDGKAIIAKKIEEATPKSLPQSPVVKKLKSDAEDEGLKGKVKSVTVSEEDLSGTWTTKGVKMSSETFYDEKGNRVKYIYYDYRGNPSNITVYGFLEGLKVSKSGYITYPYNPPPMMMSSSDKSANEKPADSRYDTKYEYKYDGKGRLIETVEYNNKGELFGKTAYSYDGNKLEKSWFNEEGKLNSKVIDILDDKSNIIEHVFVSLNSSKPDSITVYSYDSFDDKGNWTKRTIKWKDVENNSNRQSNYIQYRTITYYP